MNKQLLIYENIETISTSKHARLSVKTGDDYGFARNINSVPVMAAEFPHATQDYSIVFTGDESSVMPVVILGFRQEENLYLNDEGKWISRYIPAFIRRYPFVFSSSDKGSSFTLCIDTEFSGCNEDDRGERLFDADGNQTQYLKNVLEFLKEYQVHYQRTEAFSKKLKQLDLLEPMTAQFTLPSGDTGNLTGFMAVNREKLKQLTGEQLLQLAKTDELELIYLHIQSLQNFNRMLPQTERPEMPEMPEKPSRPRASKKKSAKTTPATATKKKPARGK